MMHPGGNARLSDDGTPALTSEVGVCGDCADADYIAVDLLNRAPIDSLDLYAIIPAFRVV